MSDIAAAHDALIARILAGSGQADPTVRRAAFENAGVAGAVGALVSKVAERPSQISDGDVAAAQAAGLSEDEIFEIVVCAAVGQATRQYRAGLAALEAASGRPAHG